MKYPTDRNAASTNINLFGWRDLKKQPESTPPVPCKNQVTKNIVKDVGDELDKRILNGPDGPARQFLMGIYIAKGWIPDVDDAESPLSNCG